MSESGNKKGSAMPPPLTQSYESAIKLNEFEQHAAEDDEVATEPGSPPGKSRAKAATAVLEEVVKDKTATSALDEEEETKVVEKVLPMPAAAPRKLITCELLPKFDGPVLQFPQLAAIADK